VNKDLYNLAVDLVTLAKACIEQDIMAVRGLELCRSLCSEARMHAAVILHAFVETQSTLTLDG
jgi:hypothetical protein